MGNGVSMTFSKKKAKNIKKKLEKLSNDIEKDASSIIFDAVLNIHRTAVKSIQQASPGTNVIRYNPKRQVIAAKAGESPNDDTGRLISSIAFNFAKSARGPSAQVGTNLKYGAWLEFGTKRMGARPWLVPAYRVHRDVIIKDFRVTIVNEVKKIGAN